MYIHYTIPPSQLLINSPGPGAISPMVGECFRCKDCEDFMMCASDSHGVIREQPGTAGNGPWKTMENHGLVRDFKGFLHDWDILGPWFCGMVKG